MRMSEGVSTGYVAYRDRGCLLAYIVCLHGRVPERYKLWSMNAQGVRKVHPFSLVRLFDNFCEDAFGLTSSIREGAVFLLLVENH